MKPVFIWGMTCLMLLINPSLHAQPEQDEIRLSRSIGFTAATAPDDKATALSNQRAEIHQGLTRQGMRQSPGVMRQQTKSSITTRHLGDHFSLHDASVLLTKDVDHDHYYTNLQLTFDVDAYHESAHVYARLFLSLEGGPWNEYYETDVFFVSGETDQDSYEVITELETGYPTGLYDVLIEIYDADSGDLLIDYGPLEDRSLQVLPLEDWEHDHYRPGYSVSGAFTGSGSFGIGGLFLLLLLRWVSGRNLRKFIAQ